MRTVSLFAMLCGVSTATAALAADATTPASRYTLAPSASGYVRLDTQTGQVSECTGTPGALICKSSADERAAMQVEIDRLQKQVDELKAATTGEFASNPPAQLNIPSDKDVDKAFNFMERMVKRFKGLIQEMRKEPAESTPL